MLFKDLTPIEEADFRKYARDNDPDDMNSWDIYHPVCRDEWMKRGIVPKKIMPNVVDEAATVLEALMPNHTRSDLISQLRSIAKELRVEFEPVDAVKVS